MTCHRHERAVRTPAGRSDNNWKVHFQTKDDWLAGAIVRPTVPKPVKLRVDPFNPQGLVEALLQAAAQRQGNQPKGASSHGR